MRKTLPARTSKTVALTAFAALAVVMAAAGVAWAANVQCVFGEPCRGTGRADTITGTGQVDTIFALTGPDTVIAKNGPDSVYGGKGRDTVKGGFGNDQFLWGGTYGESVTYPDEGDDDVHGGKGADRLFGGFGQGGRDELYGEEGADFLYANQRGFTGAEVTEEVLDCGPGRDTAVFDRGLDVVRDNCEVRNPDPMRAGGLPPGTAPPG